MNSFSKKGFVTLLILIAGLIVNLSTVQITFGLSKEPSIRKAENPVPNEYLVMLNDEVKQADIEATANRLAGKYSGKIGFYYYSVFKGFSVEMNKKDALALSREPLVEVVEENAGEELDAHSLTFVGNYENPGTSFLAGSEATQFNPINWGLDRIDQPHLPLNLTYNYTNTGANVHVYIIDTGIRSDHIELAGRIVQKIDFAGNDPDDPEDCSGHGTAVASIVGGRNTGVAKNVILHSLRITLCSSSQGVVSRKVAALDWVRDHHPVLYPGMPAVVNYSWNSKVSNTFETERVERAVNDLINAGITVVNSAGNNDDDAINYSPARLPQVLVAGATDKTDSRAFFPMFPNSPASNYGEAVDVYAPGRALMVAGKDGVNVYAEANGTSFAAPHLAGVAALYLQTNPTATPAQVQDEILLRAIHKKVQNVPSGLKQLLQKTRL